MKSLLRISLLVALLAPQFANADWAVVRSEDYDAKVDLRGIAFLDDSRGWAVGDGGTILKTDDGGHTWEQEASPEPGDDVEERFRDSLKTARRPPASVADADARWEGFRSRLMNAQLVRVLVADENTLWILGTGAVLVSRNAGESWDYVNIGTGNRMTNGVFLSADVGFAVGDNGTALGTWDGGETWESVAAGRRARAGDNRTTYEAIGFMSDDVGWIVGSSGTYRSSEDGGKTWGEPADVDFDAGENMFGIACLSPTDAWAVGQEATLLHTSDAGEYWERIENDGENFYYDLKDITFNDNHSQGWAVGDGGTILHSTDGGETWPAEDATVKHDLKAVAVTESGTAYTVGSWGVILMSAPTGVASK